MPDGLSYEEAAPVCDGAVTSLNFLKDVANLQSGQKILINGASGSLGTAAVQLAKHFGGTVTGVCSTANVEMVRALGADHVIDYTRDEFTSKGKTYDIVYDTVGQSSFSACKASLSERGVFVSPVLGLPLLMQMLWTRKDWQEDGKIFSHRPAPCGRAACHAPRVGRADAGRKTQVGHRPELWIGRDRRRPPLRRGRPQKGKCRDRSPWPVSQSWIAERRSGFCDGPGDHRLECNSSLIRKVSFSDERGSLVKELVGRSLRDAYPAAGQTRLAGKRTRLERQVCALTSWPKRSGTSHHRTSDDRRQH